MFIIFFMRDTFQIRFNVIKTIHSFLKIVLLFFFQQKCKFYNEVN